MTGKENGLFSFVLAVAIFILGGLFLERSQHKKRFFYADWDKLFFRNSYDGKTILKADKLIFIICEIVAALILINGILAYFFNLPTICILLLPIVLFVWPIRMIYIYCHLRKLSLSEREKFKNIPAAKNGKNED